VTDKQAGSLFDRLVEIMATLRSPAGCPWDRAQDSTSLKPYLLEEAYEVLEALEEGTPHKLKDELGDLLFQVIFHAQLARERGDFDIADILAGTIAKMIRRHPHVFGDLSIETADAQTKAWEEHKENERRAKATAEGRAASVLDGVAAGLPALMRALKLQRRAARVGFDWPSAQNVFLKIDEELSEIKSELDVSPSPERLLDEVGDLLFAVVNLARHLEVDPEAALRHANGKFERRFRRVEDQLAAAGRDPADASLDELEALWQRAKTLGGSHSP
jgi:nucleoside triphosphate diphosphatase